MLVVNAAIVAYVAVVFVDAFVVLVALAALGLFVTYGTFAATVRAVDAAVVLLAASTTDDV